MEDLKYPVGRFDRHAPLPAGGTAVLIDSLAGVPARMRAAVAGLSEAQIDTPYREAGWTVRQVVHHVPDSHMNAYIRIKWGLTEDTPQIKTYDEKAWSVLPDGRSAPVEVSLNLLAAIHARLDILLRSMTDKDFARAIQHPEWGELKLSTMLQLYEWHGRHHVAHITELRKRSGW
jgi:hypothetical protein